MLTLLGRDTRVTNVFINKNMFLSCAQKVHINCLERGLAFNEQVDL